jgi:hypothetical protein
VCKPVQLDDLYDALERVWVRGSPMLNESAPEVKIH